MTAQPLVPLQPLVSLEPLINNVGEDQRRHFASTGAEPSETCGDAADWAPAPGHLSLPCPYYWAIFSGQACIQPAHCRDTAKVGIIPIEGGDGVDGNARRLQDGFTCPANDQRAKPSSRSSVVAKCPTSLMSQIKVRWVTAGVGCDVSEPLQVTSNVESIHHHSSYPAGP